MAKLYPTKKASILIEIIVAIGLFMIVVPGVLYLASNSYIANLQSEENLQALAFAREGIEASASIRDYSWDNLVDGQHGLTGANGYWEFYGTEDTRDKFTRTIQISTIDSEKKNIDLTISWDTFAGLNNSITLNTELSKWQTYSTEPPTCEEHPCAEGKVYMCHFRATDKEETICVGATALPSHWNHGDLCGPCI